MRIITLLTDFGLRDGFTGAVKGMIRNICSDAVIDDVGHDIPKYSVKDAAFALLNYIPYYPEGTVHVVVVDPGVGGGRKPLIVRSDKFWIVLPDNGIIDPLIEQFECEFFEILTSELNWEISGTFDGRDVFAPVAAMLAKGVNVTEIAKKIEYEPTSLFPEIKPFSEGKLELTVIHEDRFGNLITNLRKRHNKQYGPFLNPRIRTGKGFIYGIKNHFDEVGKGECLMLWGSSGYLEIAQNLGNAAKFINLHTGGKVIFEYEGKK